MSTATKMVLGLGLFVVWAVAMSIIYVAGTYNSLAKESVAVDQAWSKVESQYQRRVDLIPNIVNATRGFMKQEQAVFDTIADARTHYAGATTPNEKAAAAGQVETALSRLMVVMENYPDLKSSETVRRLTDELAGTENRINNDRAIFYRCCRQLEGW